MQAASRPAGAPPTCWPSPRSAPSPATTGSTPSGTRAKLSGEGRQGPHSSSTGLWRGSQPWGPLHTRAVVSCLPGRPLSLGVCGGSGPSYASHTPHSWSSLPRRLPNRVPSLRMLRSFFTDGVSGLCAREGVGVLGRPSAQGPGLWPLHPKRAPPVPALFFLPAPTHPRANHMTHPPLWALSPLRDTTHPSSQGLCTCHFPSGMPFPQPPPRRVTHIFTFFRFFRPSVKFLPPPLTFLPPFATFPSGHFSCPVI